MVGEAIRRVSKRIPDAQLFFDDRSSLDLSDFNAVLARLASLDVDALVLAAARVGGILANSIRPVDFINQNLEIQLSTLKAAHEIGISRLVFLGSSCVYPRDASIPILENSLLGGKLEPSNAAYAIAKIAGIQQVFSYNQQFSHRWQVLMPTNLYGPNDNYDRNHSHVIPGLIRKFHEAKLQDEKRVEIWGNGLVRREFLHVDDLAHAIFLTLGSAYQYEIMNVGSSDEITINDLASMVADVVGWKGEVTLDTSKPSGPKSKLLDSSLIRSLGWKPTISLRDGLASTYRELLENKTEVRGWQDFKNVD